MTKRIIESDRSKAKYNSYNKYKRVKYSLFKNTQFEEKNLTTSINKNISKKNTNNSKS